MDESPIDGCETSMGKKFLTQAEKEIDFRKTVRRGFRMTQSETGFHRFR